MSASHVFQADKLHPSGGGISTNAVNQALSPTASRQAAAYIAELTHGLATLADSNRLDALGYLLQMARLEAESVLITSAEKP